MDYLRLLYVLYASYLSTVQHSNTLPTYTEFLEKLCLQLALDEVGTRSMTDAMLTVENMDVDAIEEW
mgnify:CR=1 FL=1